VTKVKICGLSRIEDIHAVNSLLPDYIGFVFAESRRQVNEKKASVLKDELDSRIKAVGVFVNEDIQRVERLYGDGIIDAVQLHGDEDADYIRRLKEDCGCTIIKTVAVGNTMPPEPEGPDYILFDTLSEQRGGTGKLFDWNIIGGYRGLPYFLAGGLKASNVQDAVRTLSPYCMDVSGGVETNGLKDAAKIEEFIKLVRTVGRWRKEGLVSLGAGACRKRLWVHYMSWLRRNIDIRMTKNSKRNSRTCLRTMPGALLYFIMQRTLRNMQAGQRSI
jgi:phosphoribosylanthranilate isomerase